MAVSVSNEYKQVIYSGDARNKLKLLFNNVELQEADRYCERLTIKSRIVPNGAKIFSLNNFISKEAELILHDIDTSIIQDQVSISIGTLVGNSYEYVPIGIFNIQDQPTNDKNKTTIKLRDNSVKFDFNYNAQPLIEENGGSATKLQILQDICTQAGVTCNITSFIGYIDEIGVYDNTITAREYISRIAEQAGKIATINRSGELIFVDLNNLTTWEIPIDIVEKYEGGTTYKIGKVVYEDGIVRYETDDSNDDTLFLDGSNNYINGELVKEQASSSNNSYSLQNTGEADLAYFELEGKTTQETRSGKNLLGIPNVNYSDYGLTIKSENGIITINGTATSTLTYDFNLINPISSSLGTLTKSLNPSGTYNGIQTSLRDNSGNSVGLWSNNASNTTGTISANAYKFRIQINSGVQVNATIMPQIEVGSTATSWEQYGAQPSPDYPSELVSVGYQNLLKLGTGTSSRNNTQLSVDNDIINFKNTGTTNYVAYGIDNELRNANYGNYVGWKNMTLKAGTYTLNYKYISGSTTTTNAGGNFLRLIVYSRPIGDTGRLETNLGNIPISTTSSYITFTITEDKEINLVVYLYGSNATIDMTFKTWITNTSKDCEYIPYGKYGIEVKTNGKNLFDENQLLEATDWQKNDGGYYYGTIGNLYQKFKSSNNGFTFPITFKENTQYTISCVVYTNTGAGNGRFEINYTDGTTQNASNWNYLIPTNIITTTQENKTIKNISFTYGSNATAYIKDIQIEEGTQATTYEEYKSNTYQYILDEPLRSIGTTKDKLYIENGYLYVDRKIGKLVLNGSETDWNNQSGSYDTATRMMFSHNCGNDIQGNVANRKGMSNYFVNYSTTVQNSNVDVTAFNFHPNINYSKYIYFKIEKSLLPTQNVAGWKSWLSTHNTEVQYVLNEPYTEELGQVDMPSTYENITYIDIASKINTNTYLQYRKDKTQLEAILDEVDEFDINSLKTGKILGNPAIDSYDLIQITDGNKIFKTLATNDLVYTGVLINTFDTQIGEEAKEQNVFINGEETFKKWARTTIDNVEGTLTLQAGEIDTANGRINETNLRIDKDGALLNVLANNSNIDVEYDSEGNPLSGEVREVTTTTGFKFNADGMTISDDSSNFYALHRNTGTYYYDGGIDPTKIVGQYTKDGSKQKDLVLFGVYYYGMEEITDTPMFVTELYNDENGEECVGHFYNRGD